MPDDGQDDARLGKVVAFARAQIGKPYVFGAVGPNSYDCSGLIVAAYRQVGLQLTHWTGALIATGEEVAKSDLQLGDLVFPDSGHVQLYSGNGNIIEAPQKGQNVQEHQMGNMWRARRVIGKGSKSKGVIETVEGAINAVSPIDEWVEFAKTANRALTNLSNIQFWQRVSQYMVGVALLIIGVIWLARRPIMSGAGMITRQVGALGESFVGGAAFGLGASKAGGTGGGLAGGSVASQMGNQMVSRGQRVPSPPAQAQISAMPVTAVNPVSPYRTQAFVASAPVPTRPQKRPLTGTFDPTANPPMPRPRKTRKNF